ncbi:MAG: OsmC family protein [Gemmatimonadota bacterium]
MADSLIREFTVGGRSTDVFGRVLCTARNHHFIIDGPVQNGCPGEEITPVEAFLAAVAACGVELVQVIAREDGVEIGMVSASIHGLVDRGNPVRTDYTVFNEINATFSVAGVEREVARSLVERFTKRCPLFGTVAVAAGKLTWQVN